MSGGMNKGKFFSNLICMIPAFVFVFSILLVRLHLFSMPLADIFWTESLDTSTLADLFGYWKSIFIIIAGILGVAFLLFGYVGGQVRLKSSFLYIPAAVYLFFTLLSLVFSKYKYFAIHGMQEHFEGTFVLLAYIAMVLFLFNALDSSERLKIVIFWILGIALILGILGLTQATGHDFLTTTAGQKIITPRNMESNGVNSWDLIDILASQGKLMYSFSFTEGEVYQTVYNINYVPLYLSLLIPVCTILFIYYRTTSNKPNIVAASIVLLLYGLLLYNFVAANSASGYFGLASSLVTACIVFRKKLAKWIKPIACLILITGLVLGVLADRWTSELKPLIGHLTPSFFTYIYADNNAESQKSFENAPADIWIPVDYIETKDGCIRFGINGNELLVEKDSTNAAFVFKDGEGKSLPLALIEGQEGFYQILDERFHDYVKLSAESDSIVQLRTRSFAWRFNYTEGNFLYCNYVGKLVALNRVPHAGIINNYFWGSNRGRIWDTTIPMLKHYLIIGGGADTYSFEFPQNDYVTFFNMRVSNSQNTVTDKAHNLYMQYWVNTGLISLLAWLTMVGFYLGNAVKQFRKRGFEDFCDFINGGIFCGIIGFLAVAFFNDGSVNTMPMFYTMLGTGLAINIRDKWPSAEKTESAYKRASKNSAKKTKQDKKAKTAMPEV